MRYNAVISTLNRPESLKACLSLIEGQTEKPARVIIVDASDHHYKAKADVTQSRDAAVEWTFLRSETKSLLCQSIHRQPPYASLVQAGGLPGTDRLTDKTLILPLFHQMTESDQSQVLGLLAGSVTES
jgi:dTDP-4-amino-4,6-dideoxygalactose transaminase